MAEVSEANDDQVDFLDVLIQRAEQEIGDGVDCDVDWEELKNHPAFTEGEVPSDHPIAEAVAAMALEEDDPDEDAQEAKKQGNFYFKCKKYRTAIKNYTEGIKKKSPNKETNAQLLGNRAAANFQLGNYRSAVRDCALACKLKPRYMKTITRGIKSCMELRRAEDAVRWCDRALLDDPENEELLNMRKEAAKLKITVERDERKDKIKERKIHQAENQILSAIKERNIRVAMGEDEKLKLHHLETQHPSGARVFLGEDGSLYWPVVFVYPEFRQTDSISAFNENSRFLDHLEMILGDSNPPPAWDPQRRYRPDAVELYFEDQEDIRLYRIKTTSTLRSVLSSNKYVVHGGTPSFLVLVKDSPFAHQFLTKYSS